MPTSPSFSCPLLSVPCTIQTSHSLGSFCSMLLPMQRFPGLQIGISKALVHSELGTFDRPSVHTSRQQVRVSTALHALAITGGAQNVRSMSELRATARLKQGPQWRSFFHTSLERKAKQRGQRQPHSSAQQWKSTAPGPAPQEGPTGHHPLLLSSVPPQPMHKVGPTLSVLSQPPTLHSKPGEGQERGPALNDSDSGPVTELLGDTVF